jgi:bifunctional DNA-binding transcriptional regulator/antitoxin component of YhaV-PrlF toxin-antitoxin module
MIDEAREVLGDGDTQTLTFCVDDDKVKIGFAYDVKVKDIDTLKEVLGERFDDLVTVKTDYKPDTKLKEMALDDDGLKECLSVKEKAPSVAVVK